MKILWIVNIILPYPSNMIGIKSTVFGGWLNSLLEGLIKCEEISEIAIAAPYNDKILRKFSDKNITYYLVPCKNNMKYDKKLEKQWYFIDEDFHPDRVHIHGTEFAHALPYFKYCDKTKTIVSIQGLVSIYGDKQNYNAGLSFFDLLCNITMRDLLKFDFLFLQYKKFLRRGKYEKKILNNANCIVGRTSWDYAHAYNICQKNKYEFCNESLRKSFYNKDWNPNKVEQHSIFISQAYYPIKGFHIMIRAAKLLIKKYPDIKIYVAGNDVTKSSKKLKDRLKLTGYGKYIKKCIKKYKLNDNIIFVGLLDENQVCDRLLKSNVFVQVSSIENSPNSLGEAMLVGMPCIASYVGGTGDMLNDKIEGLLYPYNDYIMLSNYICKIFDDNSFAYSLGKNAKKRAEATHSINTNVKRMIEIYKKDCKIVDS